MNFGKIRAPVGCMTEAWALRIACGMSMDNGFDAAIVESNLKVLIDRVNQNGPFLLGAFFLRWIKFLFLSGSVEAMPARQIRDAQLLISTGARNRREISTPPQARDPSIGTG